jgi:hypothetical protein
MEIRQHGVDVLASDTGDPLAGTFTSIVIGVGVMVTGNGIRKAGWRALRLGQGEPAGGNVLGDRRL